MFYKSTIICLLFLSAFGAGFAQFNLLNKNNGLYRLRIYLGANSDSIFTSDAIRYNMSDNRLLIGFLNYEAQQLKVLNNTSENNTVHDGIIMPAFSISKNETGGQVLFGKENDTCTVDFKKRVIKNTNGRSALISVLNVASFISDPSDHQITQSNPYQYTDYLHEQGTLTAGIDSSDYLFTYHRSTGSSNLDGWLVLSGDTLYLKIPPIQITHGGKLKKTKHLKYDPGVILVKDDTTYAALDFAVNPVKVYILYDLSKMQKLKIAAFLFTILSEM